MARTAPVSRTIAALGGTVDEALGDVQVPAYVVSSDGTVRWLNTRALAVLGDVRGQPFASAVMPDSLHAARFAFARKIAGTKRATDYDVTLRSAAGEPVSAQVSSVAIRGDHRVVGIFGLIHINEMPDPTRLVRHPHLTPRQQEVHRLSRPRLLDRPDRCPARDRAGDGAESRSRHSQGARRPLPARGGGGRTQERAPA